MMPPSTRPARQPRLRAASALVVAITMGVIPAVATPHAARAAPVAERSNRLADLRARGEKAQRLAETRQRKWDRKMKAVSGSICIGC